MKVAALFVKRSAEASAAVGMAGAGMHLDAYHDLPTLVSALRVKSFDALVLEDSGDDVLHWISALQARGLAHLPIVVFGSGGGKAIQLAVRHGATDYATSGDGADALAQRVEARIQLRQAAAPKKFVAAGDFVLQADTHSLLIGTQAVSLTNREFALAWRLFEGRGQVVSMNTLSTEIWGRSGDIGKRTIEQHVYRLRRKFEQYASGDGAWPIIRTVYGVGYCLEVK